MRGPTDVRPGIPGICLSCSTTEERSPQTLITGLESGFLLCLPLSGDLDGAVLCMWVAFTFFQGALGFGG